jgi:beta-lactam-binding protein with PASTA domain
VEERTTEIRRDPPPPWYEEHWWLFLVVLLLIVGGIVAYFALRDTDGGEPAGTATTVQQTQTETVTTAETETVATTETVEPQTVEMPDAVGRDHLEAADEVFAAGLVGDTYPVPSDEERGLVVAQNPAAGAEVELGSVVRLNVSLGVGERGDRDVPDVTGVELEEAHRLCREAGFTCRTVYRNAPGEEQVGKVLDQAPAFGAVVEELTQMTLYTGR